MSFIVRDEKGQPALRLKTSFDGRAVEVSDPSDPGYLFASNDGTRRIPVLDFLQGAIYVLTNNNLIEGDDRIEFVECIKSIREVPGYSRRGRHFQLARPFHGLVASIYGPDGAPLFDDHSA